MGWGLWLLSEMVRSTGGELWIWSGDASYAIHRDGSDEVSLAFSLWPGVIINLTLFPENIRSLSTTGSEKMRALAEDLGL